MAIVTTEEMGLTLPEVSTTRSYGTYSQDWAAYISGDFFITDSHDHTPSRGNQINWSSLISSGLSLNNFVMEEVVSLQFILLADESIINPQSAYTDGTDLFWKNSIGTSVQITDGGTIPVNTTGGFFGDYGTDGSKATFVGDSNSFFFFGLDSADYANVEASSFSSTNISTSDLSGLIVGTGTSNFVSLAGYTGYIGSTYEVDWIKWYDTSMPVQTSSRIYPYAAKRDSAGAVKLNSNINYGSMYGFKSQGFEGFYNQEGYYPFEYKLKVYFSEQPVTGNGWFSQIFNNENTYTTKSFTITESTTNDGSVATDCVYMRKLLLLIPSYDDNGNALNGTLAVYSNPIYYYTETNNGPTKTIKITFKGNRIYLPWQTRGVIGSTDHVVTPYVTLVGLVRSNLS